MEFRKLGILETEAEYVRMRRIYQVFQNDLMNKQHRFETDEFTAASNFDSPIRGLVCNCFTVRNPEFMTALSIIGGRKTIQHCCQRHSNGRCDYRPKPWRKKLTIISLQDIVCKPIIPKEKIALAQASYGKECIPGIEAIVYGHSMHNVMKNIFGNVFVRPTAEIAKKISRDHRLRYDTITLNGQSLSIGHREYGDGTRAAVENYYNISELS